MLIAENVLMTPELASKFLESSQHNARKPARTISLAYAKAMYAGDFVWSAQSRQIIVEKSNPFSVIDVNTV